MKIVQILNEYNRDISTEKWGDKLFAAAQKDGTIINYTPGQGYDNQQTEKFFVLRHLLHEFEAADPTPNNKYVPWIIRKYSEQNGKLKLEDISTTLSDDLESFSKLVHSKKIPIAYRDINKFKTPDQFYDAVEKFSTPIAKSQEDRGEYEEYLNNDEVRIIIPKDAKAARFWGQRTRWCTASKKNEDSFFSYGGGSRWAPLFIIIPKHPTHSGEKYQTQGKYFDYRYGNHDASLVDEKDHQLSPEQTAELQKRLKLYQSLSKEKFDLDFNWDAYNSNHSKDWIDTTRGEKGRMKSGEDPEIFAKDPQWLFRSPKEILRRGRTKSK